MRWITALLFVLFLPFSVHAQSTAEPVLPGLLTTSGCPGNQPSCFVPYSVSNPLPVTGGGGAPTIAACALLPSACVTFFGYADIRWYGAICDYTANGTAHDISTVINTAVGSGGIQASGAPIYIPEDCNTNNELQVLAQNQTWFGPPHQPTYSKFNIAQPFLHVNTGAIQAGAENCAIEINSHQGFTRRSLVLFGDSFTHETSGLCTNTNTNNADGSFQAPVVDDRDVSTLNMGNYIGCPSNPDGTAPTGALCGNVILWHAENIISGYNQNDVTGNMSDPKIKGFTFDSTACDSIWPDDGSHAPSGNWENGRIEAGGFSSNCPSGTAADAVHINGDRQNFVGVQIETWGGNAYTFDTLYTRPSITGGFVHNVGTDKVTNHQAVFSFNGSNASFDQHASIQGVRVLADNASPDATHNQLYIVDYLTTNNDYQDGVGIEGGATAYASGGSFFHGTIPAHVNMQSSEEIAVSQLNMGKIYSGTYYLDAMNGGNYLSTLDGYMTFVAGFARAFQVRDTGGAQNWLYAHGSASGSPALSGIGCDGNSTDCSVDITPKGSAYLSVSGNPVTPGGAHVAPRTGRFYTSDFAATSTVTAPGSTSAVSYNCMPIYQSRWATPTAMALDVTVASTTNSWVADMAIYTDNAGVPGTLVIDIGATATGNLTIASATTGAQIQAIPGGSQVATAPGLYWGCLENTTPAAGTAATLASVNTGSPGVIANTEIGWALTQNSALPTPSTGVTYVGGSGSIAAFPASAATLGSVTNPTAATPVVWIKY